MGNGQWNGTTRDQSALKNAMAPFTEVTGSWRRDFEAEEEKHAADLAAIMPQAEALIP